MYKQILLSLSLIIFAVSAGYAKAGGNQFQPINGISPNHLPAKNWVEPALEPGFPVQTLHLAGIWYGRHGIQAVVGNIDNEPTLEIIVTGIADGPLYAWNSDGTPVSGWPLNYYDDGYPAIGNLVGDDTQNEIFAAYLDGHLSAFDGSGNPLSGWPQESPNSMRPPVLADIENDGMDEIFLGEEDLALHAYKADGTPLPGWPVSSGLAGQSRNTPAIGDIDGDEDYEIISASGATTPGVYLFAYHHDGSTVAGFPVLFPNDGYDYSVPAIGDVDGDGTQEIVIIERGNQWRPYVNIVAPDGTIERSFPAEGDVNPGAPLALADLDGDIYPEIIIQANGALSVYKGDGSTLAGWPIHYGENVGNTAPVIGDVDGDKWPEVVVALGNKYMWAGGRLDVIDRNGKFVSFSPIPFLGQGGIPAIADIDLDGRNEIVMVGFYWDGVNGYFDKVWVYDMGGPPHGNIYWGQYGNGANHQGYYIPVTPPTFINTYLPVINR